MINTELAYAALFDLLASLKKPSGSFVTVSRRLRHVEDVDPAQMPGIYQLQLSRTPEAQTFNGIATWILRAHWYIYVSAPNMNAPSSPLLNPRVDDALALLPQEPNQAIAITLNGQQVILTMDGPVEFFEGLLDTKAVARIPLKMIVPNNG